MRITNFIYASYLNYRAQFADTLLGIWWGPISTTLIVFVIYALFGDSYENKIGYLIYLSNGYFVWTWITQLISAGADQYRTYRLLFDKPSWNELTFLLYCSINRIITVTINCSPLIVTNLVAAGFNAIVGIFILFFIMIMLDGIISFLLSNLSLIWKDFKFLLGQLNRALFFASPIFWGFIQPNKDSVRWYLFEYNPVSIAMRLVRAYPLSNYYELDVPILKFCICSAVCMAFALILYIVRPKYWRNIQ